MSAKYPVQVMTSDAAVLHCLRALAFYSETGNKQSSVAGVTNDKWQSDDEVVTFNFSSADARDMFQQQVDRLLPGNLIVLQVPVYSVDAAA